MLKFSEILNFLGKFRNFERIRMVRMVRMVRSLADRTFQPSMERPARRRFRRERHLPRRRLTQRRRRRALPHLDDTEAIADCAVVKRMRGER